MVGVYEKLSPYKIQPKPTKRKKENPMKTEMKGDLVACYHTNNHVHLWFSSPTGDSSDVQVKDIICRDNQQAEMVAKRHREVWGLPENP